MVALGAPVAAAPDGWATRASPDPRLYVICIAAGGFSSHRQLQHHLSARSSSPGMAAGSNGQERPSHAAVAGTVPGRGHHAGGGSQTLAVVALEGQGQPYWEQSWHLPCPRGQRTPSLLAVPPARWERPSCCTCPLGDVLPTRCPVTVTERVRSWAAWNPGDR